MHYHYQVYGIPLVSEIELPALLASPGREFNVPPIQVTLGNVPLLLDTPPLETKPLSTFNERELLYFMPEVARYYIKNGKQIIIEPHCDNWDTVLLFFYSNCLAAVLYQRDIIPYHVSGVFMEPGRVLLFAAPSRTGKSTTAVMLHQKGYPLFTDDTAVFTVAAGMCYAQASYPMLRLWKNTIDQQTVLNKADKRALRDDLDLDKYGFHFHDQFTPTAVAVGGIVFLEEQGPSITIERLNPKRFMQLFGSNTYRGQWIAGMRKQMLQFKTLTSIANAVPAWRACRPKGEPTFQRFADAIDEQIIKDLLSRKQTAL